MPALVYLVATSLDGFIADRNGSTAVFEDDLESARAVLTAYPDTCPAHLRDVFGLSEVRGRFEAVVMGARTHQPALDAGLTSAYPHLDQYVAAHGTLPIDPTVTQWTGDVRTHLRNLRSRVSGDIWLCGGGGLASQLIDEIDELHLKVHPVLLGAGVPVVADGIPATHFLPSGTTPFPGGVQVVTYRRRDV